MRSLRLKALGHFQIAKEPSRLAETFPDDDILPGWRPAAPFDFETKSSYTIRVRSTQGGGVFLEKAFTIAVTDVAEPPTVAVAGPSAGVRGQTLSFTLSASDPDAGTYPECKVVYALQAPNTPGDYMITAAFLYGTEKATTLGRVEGPGGRVLPLGGGGAHSGRIAFAKPIKVTVQ